MKVQHVVVSAALLAGLVFAARSYLPGVKAKIDTFTEKHTGWTEEARRNDPVGYIDYALGKLGENLDKFQAAKQELAQAKLDAKQKLEEYDGKHSAAVTLSEEARDIYQAAEEAGGYPVQLLSKSYTKDELVNQVQLILAERDTYASSIEKFKEVIAMLEKTQANLTTRITTTQGSITELKAQREVVKIQKLTSEADALLAKVDDILGKNEEALSILDDPVRSVEDLLKAGTESEEGEPVEAATAEALQFLQT